MRPLRYSLLEICLLAVFTAAAGVGEARSEVKSVSVQGELAPKIRPNLPKPAAGERPTADVDGIQFFERFNRAELQGHAHLGTGGYLVNKSEVERSARVCIAFLDGQGNLVHVEVMDMTLGKGQSNAMMPLRAVPEELIDKIKKYQLTMHVSPDRLLN